ncbi:caspase domain-containing protein [Hyphomonas jannaschiana]|uniref:caspase domain-containing protein n=1 Tax=Hyphomonas jannaschiana TaxID=86 RepID=UPI0035C746E7
MAGYPADELAAVIQSAGVDPYQPANREMVRAQLMVHGVAYEKTDEVLRYFGIDPGEPSNPGSASQGSTSGTSGGSRNNSDDYYMENGPGSPPGEEESAFNYQELESMLRAYGYDVPANATADELEALFYDALESMPEPAAAGPGNMSQCQAELEDPETISLICELYDDIGRNSELKTAKVPVGDDLTATLRRIAVQVSGGMDRLELGMPDARLCVWNMDGVVTQENYMYFGECGLWTEPLSKLVEAGAGNFNTGRVAHQAPNEMVVDQAYFLEIAIQPLTQNISVEAADTMLTSTLGTGLAPGSTETPFAISFDTVKASKIMSATLEGDDEFEIRAMTPEQQAVLPDAPTVWKWRVVPKEDGAGYLQYNLSQSLEIDGERFDRSVKTIWLDVDVSTIDDLLEDDEPPATRDTSIMASTLVAPTNNGTPEMMSASAEAGCTFIEGSDPDRFAMVLSNLAYKPPISRLAVTHADGDRITDALLETGFSVQRCRDTGRNATLSALREVGRKSLARKQAGAHPATFFYYSGHGVNIDGTNYVLPVDLPGASTAEIEDGAVSFEQIFNIVSTTVASTSFIVFDACRTVMDDESRGMLRSYQPVTWSTGVFQAYATEPGKTAADDGAYSEELAQRIPAAGVPANVLFKRVQDAVARRTNEQQHPNYIDLTTGGDFYFQPE